MTQLGELQWRVAQWVINTFGVNILWNKKERAMRLIEEAIEVGQVAGLEPSDIEAITKRVYGRPVGTIRQELGGTAVCLLAAAQSFGIDLQNALVEEVERIESIPADYFRKRSTEKAAAGVGFPPEVSE